MLLISAKDDQLWPSTVLAGMIMDRLKRRGHPFPDQHLAYESAGHLIGKAYLPAGSPLIAGGRLATGGTPEGNARAQEDSWPKVLKFLKAAFRRRAAWLKARLNNGRAFGGFRCSIKLKAMAQTFCHDTKMFSVHVIAA